MLNAHPRPSKLVGGHCWNYPQIKFGACVLTLHGGLQKGIQESIASSVLEILVVALALVCGCLAILYIFTGSMAR